MEQNQGDEVIADWSEKEGREMRLDNGHVKPS